MHVQKLNTMRRSLEEEQEAVLEAALEEECGGQTPGHLAGEGKPRVCVHRGSKWVSATHHTTSGRWQVTACPALTTGASLPLLIKFHEAFIQLVQVLPLSTFSPLPPYSLHYISIFPCSLMMISAPLSWASHSPAPSCMTRLPGHPLIYTNTGTLDTHTVSQFYPVHIHGCKLHLYVQVPLDL